MVTERLCTDCQAWSALPWKGDDDKYEFTIPCESCGEHPAVVCPKCGKWMDLIYEKKEHLRDVE